MEALIQTTPATAPRAHARRRKRSIQHLRQTLQVLALQVQALQVQTLQVLALQVPARVLPYNNILLVVRRESLHQQTADRMVQSAGL